MVSIESGMIGAPCSANGDRKMHATGDNALVQKPPLVSKSVAFDGPVQRIF
jgi:hypothetical protein